MMYASQVWTLCNKEALERVPRMQKRAARIILEAQRTSRTVRWIPFYIACEEAPGGASAEQTFGAKRRAIGACTHSPKSPMSASKFWTQSGDWWIIIIHDVILVFTSGIDKNQNGAKETSGSSRGLSAFIKLFEIGARTA